MALIGTFVGDVLGMPVEGWSASRIEERHGDVDEMLASSPSNFGPDGDPFGGRAREPKGRRFDPSENLDRRSSEGR